MISKYIKHTMAPTLGIGEYLENNFLYIIIWQVKTFWQKQVPTPYSSILYSA